MSGFEAVILGVYGVCALGLCVFGAHRWFLTGLFTRTLGQGPRPGPQRTPSVTVQLPLYNEPHVVERLVEAACRLDWPDLQIQILDDSSDATTQLARAAAARFPEVDVEVIRRPSRMGFKAGALAHGLERARGEFIAVFDADFVPAPDFLRRVVPHFREGIGMVQARWGHLNGDDSLLTRLQAILLDGHFVVEHTARHRSGRWFNFNGTAGIWRRQAIEDAGGWDHDTLTEDLDLSYRAQLAGWAFLYVPEVVVPAELPPTMLAFKSQQHRWAKGSIQTLKKLASHLWRAEAPWPVRLEALVHLSNNLAYPLVVSLALLTPLAVWIRARHIQSWLSFDLLVFALATVGVGLFYTASQWAVHADWRVRVRLLPAVLALGIGLAVNQTRAVGEALFGHTSPFVRTPKAGARGAIHLPGSAWSVVELALGLLHVVAAGWAVSRGYWASVPLELLLASGFLYVGAWGSLRKGSPTTSEAEVAAGSSVASIPQATSSGTASQPVTSSR
ncbi:MAG TPA: glycosyltransferase [Myxococcota bacterium]|nr:glycosyltransferase [Myxococcota bacterium]